MPATTTPTGVIGTAEAVMSYMRSDSPGALDCICCDGPHVFAYALTIVGDEAFDAPGPVGPYQAGAKEWIEQVKFRIPEGARVRLTVEIVDTDA